jgi:hypothetical protein
MALKTTRFAAEHVDMVREFNRRIALGGWGEYHFPSDTELFDKSANTPARWEGWLVMDAAAVRGGYLLKHQEFSFSGDLRPVAFYNLSVSEGVVDRAFSGVSLRMATHAVTENPLLFALGMGSRDRPLPRFLKGLGWDLYDVPFLFRILRPARVLGNLTTLRSTPFRRLAFNLAAYSGIGAAGIGLLQARKRFGAAPKQVAVAHEVSEFGGWADDLWRRCHGSYAMIARRDSLALNTLYPATFERLIRLRIESGGAVIGWVIVRATRMHGHKQFGNLHVGSIVDCLAEEADASLVIRGATRFLEGRGVDLIVSNQTHRAWCTALDRAGYLRGPSNYILAVSRPLSRLLGPLETSAGRVHVNRGDGDGPINI